MPALPGGGVAARGCLSRQGGACLAKGGSGIPAYSEADPPPLCGLTGVKT